MKRVRWAKALWLLPLLALLPLLPLLAAEDRGATPSGGRRALQAPPPARSRVQLGEHFKLGQASDCVIQRAEPYLAERVSEPATQRPAADALVLRVVAACESGLAQLAQAEWTWVSPAGDVAPSTQNTTTPSVEEPLLQRVFEAPPGSLIPSPRWQFAPHDAAADTGAGAGEIRIRSGEGDIDIALRDAPGDPRLYDAVSSVLSALRSGSAACPAVGCDARIRNAHAAGAFTPQLELVEFPANLDATRDQVELRLSRPGVSGSVPLGLTFSRATGGGWALHDVRPPVGHAPEPHCEGLETPVRRRLRDAFAASGGTQECNVLGWLVPEACAQAADDDAFIQKALRILRACAGSHAQSLLHPGGARPPADFHLTLRRDRCRGALDRCPRYTLALYENGAVVFHGKHRVSHIGRSDGRTHPALLAGLWRQLREMDFMTRKGGGFSHEPRCSARGSDHGNLLRVEAGGKSRMVVDRDGCRGPFSAEEIDSLADLVDATANVDLWTHARPDYADRDVQIWTLAGDPP